MPSIRSGKHHANQNKLIPVRRLTLHLGRQMMQCYATPTKSPQQAASPLGILASRLPMANGQLDMGFRSLRHPHTRPNRLAHIRLQFRTLHSPPIAQQLQETRHDRPSFQGPRYGHRPIFLSTCYCFPHPMLCAEAKQKASTAAHEVEHFLEIHRGELLDAVPLDSKAQELGRFQHAYQSTQYLLRDTAA